MSKPYYIYVTEDCIDEASEIIEKIKPAGARGRAVFVIGKDADITKLKQEINYVLDKDYQLYCVMLGYPKMDSGLALQVGLAKTYDPDAESIEKLLSDLKQRDAKPKNFVRWIAIIVVALISALIVILIASKLKLGIFKEPETVQAESYDATNLDLDEVYLKAFIDAGLDCIVEDGLISDAELEQAEALDLSGLGISDLEPLLYATNLKELDISNNNISDITKLAALGKLEKLNISGNPIKDYSVLDYLTNLKETIKD